MITPDSFPRVPTEDDVPEIESEGLKRDAEVEREALDADLIDPEEKGDDGEPNDLDGWRR